MVSTLLPSHSTWYKWLSGENIVVLELYLWDMFSELYCSGGDTLEPKTAQKASVRERKPPLLLESLGPIWSVAFTFLELLPHATSVCVMFRIFNIYSGIIHFYYLRYAFRSLSIWQCYKIAYVFFFQFFSYNSIDTAMKKKNWIDSHLNTFPICKLLIF